MRQPQQDAAYQSLQHDLRYTYKAIGDTQVWTKTCTL